MVHICVLIRTDSGLFGPLAQIMHTLQNCQQNQQKPCFFAGFLIVPGVGFEPTRSCLPGGLSVLCSCKPCMALGAFGTHRGTHCSSPPVGPSGPTGSGFFYFLKLLTIPKAKGKVSHSPTAGQLKEIDTMTEFSSIAQERTTNRCIGSLEKVPESTTYVKNARRHVDCLICGQSTFVQTRFNLKNARLGLVIVANHGIAAPGKEA